MRLAADRVCLALLIVPLWACRTDPRGLGSGVVRAADASVPDPGPEILPDAAPAPDRPARGPVDVAPSPDAARDARRASEAPSADAPDTRAPIDAFRPVPPDAAPEARPLDPALARGLLLYLPLDDGAGTTARDESGQGNNAVLRSLDASSWADGRFGRGLLLRGGSAGAFLRVDGAEIFTTIMGGLTVSAWVQGLPGADASGLVVSRFAAGSNGFLYAFGIDQGRGRLQLNSSNGYFADLRSEAVLPRDTWVHLAATFDMELVRLYVDGRPSGSMPYLLGIAPGNAPIVVGGGQSDTLPVSRFAGRLDEVMLYNRALSPAEVAALARGARPPAP